MAAAVAQYYFRFRIYTLPKFKTYLQTKFFIDIITIYNWDITISGLEKQTSAILEFFFRLRLRPSQWSACYSAPVYQISSKSDHPRRRHDLLLIFKMAAGATVYYFQFRIWWCHFLPKVNIYQQTKFHRHILIHGWDTTTSGLKKTTVRHIGILLPVSVLRKSSFGYRQTNKRTDEQMDGSVFLSCKLAIASGGSKWL